MYNKRRDKIKSDNIKHKPIIYVIVSHKTKTKNPNKKKNKEKIFTKIKNERERN